MRTGRFRTNTSIVFGAVCLALPAARPATAQQPSSPAAEFAARHGISLPSVRPAVAVGLAESAMADASEAGALIDLVTQSPVSENRDGDDRITKSWTDGNAGSEPAAVPSATEPSRPAAISTAAKKPASKTTAGRVPSPKILASEASAVDKIPPLFTAALAANAASSDGPLPSSPLADPLPSSPWATPAAPGARTQPLPAAELPREVPANHFIEQPPAGVQPAPSPLEIRGPLANGPARSGRQPTPNASTPSSTSTPTYAAADDTAWGGVPKAGLPLPGQNPPPRREAASNVQNPAALQPDRRALLTAQQISGELRAERPKPSAIAPAPLESPRGWGAVGEELLLRLDGCDELLRRGAVLSARDEALQGMRCLARSVDARGGRWESEPALDRAVRALDEQRDFYTPRVDRRGGAASPAAGHQTAVLRGEDLRGVSPMVAAQHYRAYAREQLVLCAAAHPWSADLMYALGRTYEAEADGDGERAAMLREQAACCYQAALGVQATHRDAANQLGYVMLKLDRLDEAESTLASVISQGSHAKAWQNLAELYRRRGDDTRSRQAAQQAVALDTVAGRVVEGKPVPEVVELTPAEFARYSPNLTPGQAAAAPPPQSFLPQQVPQQTTEQTAAAATVPVESRGGTPARAVSTPLKPSGSRAPGGNGGTFFDRIFR